MSEPITKQLLIVDDDPSMHELVNAMLARTEWGTTSALSGEEALKQLETQPFDLVLTDILMPGMDGLTLLTKLRALYPQVRVVAMTIKNTPDHVVGSLRHEAAGYVTKPFTRNALLQALREAHETSLDQGDIKVLSDHPQWVSLQIRCKLATAERLTQFIRELPSELGPDERENVAIAFRELLVNAIEHGGHLDPKQIVDMSYIRTARTIVYYIRDPGDGFSRDKLPHAAGADFAQQPMRHIDLREEMGLRPGGFGMLMAKKFADEVIYSAKGNEVLLIKYL
jgi:CheY-like chemotaxis protein/anti-sigma regulatory factor (Ser/Thr protein kinase)